MAIPQPNRAPLHHVGCKIGFRPQTSGLLRLGSKLKLGQKIIHQKCGDAEWSGTWRYSYLSQQPRPNTGRTPNVSNGDFQLEHVAVTDNLTVGTTTIPSPQQTREFLHDLRLTPLGLASGGGRVLSWAFTMTRPTGERIATNKFHPKSRSSKQLGLCRGR